MRERFTESYLGTWELFGENDEDNELGRNDEKKLGEYKLYESNFRGLSG